MNLYGRQFCASDSTKQSEKASEGAEQAVTNQYKYSMGTYDSTAETILLPCGDTTYSTLTGTEETLTIH